MNAIILGTRGSDLALVQSRIVRENLQKSHPHLAIATRIIKTSGDRRLKHSPVPSEVFEKGLFIKELEEALLKNEITAAVHSLKDLPIDQPDGLTIVAILQRANPYDALVSKFPGGIAALPKGAIVGTGSPRRKAQLLKIRPDLHIEEIHGNVPARLRKLAESPNRSAVLLAKAGLDRLGPGFLPPDLHVSVTEEILPAPGQGAIAMECRTADNEARQILHSLHHEETARCVTAEREILRKHGGGCNQPIGALAQIENNILTIKTFGVE